MPLSWMPSEQTKLTIEQFADELWSFLIRKQCREFKAALVSEVAASMQLDQHDYDVLSWEILIAHLWAISKTFAPEKTLLDSLHNRYVLAASKVSDRVDRQLVVKVLHAELAARYDTYYNAWNSDALKRTGLLGFEMLQHFLPRYKPVLDASLIFSVQMRIYSFIDFLCEVRKDIKLIE